MEVSLNLIVYSKVSTPVVQWRSEVVLQVKLPWSGPMSKIHEDQSLNFIILLSVQKSAEIHLMGAVFLQICRPLLKLQFCKKNTPTKCTSADFKAENEITSLKKAPPNLYCSF